MSSISNHRLLLLIFKLVTSLIYNGISVVSPRIYWYDILYNWYAYGPNRYTWYCNEVYHWYYFYITSILWCIYIYVLDIMIYYIENIYIYIYIYMYIVSVLPQNMYIYIDIHTFRLVNLYFWDGDSISHREAWWMGYTIDIILYVSYFGINMI
jgi:hypothetical protein